METLVAVVILVDPGLSSSDCSFLFQPGSQVGLQTCDVWYKASLNLHRDPSSSQRSLAMFVIASSRATAKQTLQLAQSSEEWNVLFHLNTVLILSIRRCVKTGEESRLCFNNCWSSGSQSRWHSLRLLFLSFPTTDPFFNPEMQTLLGCRWFLVSCCVG